MPEGDSPYLAYRYQQYPPHGHPPPLWGTPNGYYAQPPHHLYPGPYNYPSTQQHLTTSRASVAHSADSLPFTPCDLATFCERAGLGDQVRARLEQLGYIPGDDIHALPREVWEKEGFKFLEWQRVLKAEEKYRQESNGRA
jgi:hypothetical protein